MNTMPTDSHLTTTADELESQARKSLQTGKECVTSCCDSIRRQSSELCETTAEAVRRNPLSSVIGAAFMGAAVCYLILENRSQPTVADRYVSGPLSDARDGVQDALRSIFDSLKFW